MGEHDPSPPVVVLDLSGTADTSVTVMDVFAELERDLAASGSTLWFAALPSRALAKSRGTARWDQLRADGRVHGTVAAALAAPTLAGEGGDGPSRSSRP